MIYLYHQWYLKKQLARPSKFISNNYVVNVKTLRWGTPEPKHQAYAIVSYADALAPNGLQTSMRNGFGTVCKGDESGCFNLMAITLQTLYLMEPFDGIKFLLRGSPIDVTHTTISFQVFRKDKSSWSQ